MTNDVVRGINALRCDLHWHFALNQSDGNVPLERGVSE